MTPFETRRTLRAPARTCMLLAVAVPCICFAQSAFEPTADRQRQIIERIEQEQSRSGPHSEALIGPLTALALLYQENEDRALAAATVERVRQIVRVNYGLHSLEQAPLIRQLITHVEAIGDVETAWELEQELLALARRHPDDLRTVDIYRETADRRIGVLRRFLSGEFPPQIVLGCYYDWKNASENRHCAAGAEGDAVRTLSLDARRSYADAISVLLRNELYSSDDLRELEMSLVRSADFIRSYNEERRKSVDYVGSDLTPYAYSPRWQAAMESLDRLTTWQRSSDAPVREQAGLQETGSANTLTMSLSNYLTGRLSLERLFAYEGATSGSWSGQIGALVQIADWDLLHSENRSALEGYELAYEMLKAAGTAQTLIDELFRPDTPVVLPAFRPNPLASSGKSQQATGYVEAAFTITRYGESRRIEILDATTNVTDAVRDELVRLVKSSRFRPRVTDDRLDTSRVVVRRYLNE